jgi:hypothetical protein
VRCMSSSSSLAARRLRWSRCRGHATHSLPHTCNSHATIYESQFCLSIVVQGLTLANIRADAVHRELSYCTTGVEQKCAELPFWLSVLARPHQGLAAAGYRCRSPQAATQASWRRLQGVPVAGRPYVESVTNPSLDAYLLFLEVNDDIAPAATRMCSCSPLEVRICFVPCN